MPPLTIRTRGYLPHWESPTATYAVTFRLADSLPQSVLIAYARERHAIVDTAQQLQRALTPQEQTRLAHLFSERIDTYLDRGTGACHLRDPIVAEIVANALGYFDGTRYTLFTWCVMPNHVHVLIRPTTPHTLDKILHAWKSYTAHAANEVLGRQGSFWMPEYYDHLIRDKADFVNQHQYVLNDPLKAGLANWKWVGTRIEHPF